MTYSSLSSDELVRACAESENAEAWKEFVCRSERLISMVIWRVSRRYRESSHAVIEDLVQDTYAKVCEDDRRLLRDFKPQHPDAFFGMLKVIAANVARDYFRARNTTKRGSGKSDLELSETEAFIPSSNSSGSDHTERQILLREIDTVLSTLCRAERDREIFWLHYRQGLTAISIAQIGEYGLTAKGVESILHRLRSQLRAALAVRPPSNRRTPSGGEGIQDKNTLSKGEGQP